MSESSPQNTKHILKKHDFRFKKKWGQNFIFDTNLLRRIVDGANIHQGDTVVEIGPGAGTLTKALAEEGAKVLAIEIDQSLSSILEEMLKGLDVHVVFGDVMQLNLDEIVKNKDLEMPYKVVANLPYYITTPIIMDLIEKKYNIDLIVVMMQWEVAQRLTAEAGTKEYGAISLAVQYYCEANTLFKVPRHLFMPVPAVDSAVVQLKKRDTPPVDVDDEKLLFKLIKAAFGQRRKVLLNALGTVTPKMDKEKIAKILEECNIDAKRRGETLTLEEFARLSNAWSQEG